MKSIRWMISVTLTAFVLATALSQSTAQIPANAKYGQDDKFRQLDELLPTPNDYRTASGAPGVKYWQQQADYEIDVELDDVNQRVIGSETIAYTNNSPDALSYLWLQLDANLYAPNADNVLVSSPPDFNHINFTNLRWLMARQNFNGGIKITSVKDSNGSPLVHAIVKTMMRVDLKNPLPTGKKVTFSVDWNYAINQSKYVHGRTGCEFFDKDGNFIYEIAQWYPRMAPYTDATGWQHKQFLGAGEFALEFGNFLVRITAPGDHAVAATGVLRNPEKVLTPAQRQRLKEAGTAPKPVFIITPDEAKANEKTKPSGKKTWEFKAENVRDFAFASSRKFIWDAQGHKVGNNTVMAMSFYPNEGEPLWSQYSTHAVIHTLDVYSKFTFDYPYPVAISVNGPVGGMEYPMICFNGPRPEKDGTYDKGTKYGLISVVIHEVGHNYFPMVVNSDERQWTWMDEGFNSFLQYLAEQEWEEDYPSWRGEPHGITGFMSSRFQVPIMTNSESLLQFSNNAYAKTATSLNVLRETVLGRELFDFAFKEYANRWAFKHPMPADFFRTMEDATGIDLDWFWRGWYYTTDHTDVAIENLRLHTLNTGDPVIEKDRLKQERAGEPPSLSKQRNELLPKRIDRYPELRDFYNEYDRLDVTDEDKQNYENYLKKLEDGDKELLETNYNFYIVDLANLGGLVMPVILRIDYEDTSHQELRVPAEIWRQDNKNVSKLIMTEKVIASLTLDPHRETADANLENNYFPRKIGHQYFKVDKPGSRDNPMQEQIKAEEKKKKQEEEKKKEEEENKEKTEGDNTDKN